jgi:hypothetical protein
MTQTELNIKNTHYPSKSSYSYDCYNIKYIIHIKQFLWPTERVILVCGRSKRDVCSSDSISGLSKSPCLPIYILWIFYCECLSISLIFFIISAWAIFQIFRHCYHYWWQDNGESAARLDLRLCLALLACKSKFGSLNIPLYLLKGPEFRA